MFKVGRPGGYKKMLTSADKVGGWVEKGQKHADVILDLMLLKLYYLILIKEMLLNLSKSEAEI